MKLESILVYLLLLGTQVLGILGVLGVIISAILYYFMSDLSGFIGNLSTIVSIVLGVASIVYTFISGSDTTKQLLEMHAATKKELEKVREELGPEDNFGDHNSNQILDKIGRKSNLTNNTQNGTK